MMEFILEDSIQEDSVEEGAMQKDSTIYGDKHWTMIIKLKWINNLHNIRTSVDLTILQAPVKIKYLAEEWSHKLQIEAFKSRN